MKNKMEKLHENIEKMNYGSEIKFEEKYGFLIQNENISQDSLRVHTTIKKECDSRAKAEGKVLEIVFKSKKMEIAYIFWFEKKKEILKIASRHGEANLAANRDPTQWRELNANRRIIREKETDNHSNKYYNSIRIFFST